MQKIFPYLFVDEPKTPKFSDLKAEFSRKVRKKLQINVQKKKRSHLTILKYTIF